MSDEEPTLDVVPDVALPDSHEAITTEIPHTVAHFNELVGAAFRAANAKRARSQQRALGMSELGGCRRQAGFKVTNTPESNPEGERTDIYADSREAMVGTMIHETILPQIAEMSMTAEIEKPVVLKFSGLPEIPGSADMVDEDLLLDVKGLALDTEIPTPTGWTTMAMLQPGDQVLDRWGKPCTVTAVTEVKNIGCYRVTFKGVGSIVCDEEHIWPARFGGVQTKSGKRVADWPITELEDAWLNGKVVAVPVSQPLDLPEASLPIDPYLVGYWLGDGTKAVGEITTGVEDAEHVAEAVRSAGYTATVRWLNKDDGSEGLRGARILTQGGFTADLRASGLLGTKTLPKEYLRGSIDQRLALLQGLMDSDGGWNTARNRAQFTSTDPVLTDAVRELVTSLGLRAQTHNVLRTGFGKTVMSYDVEFTPSGGWNPFRLKRKADRVYVPGKKNRNWHGVTSIERIDSVPTKCIAVDARDHTYLAGRAMIPTHNCVVPSTPILMADGRVKRADEVKVDDMVVAYDQIHDRLAVSYLTSVEENGDQPTVEIVTASGRMVRVTNEHPVWIKRTPDSLGEWIKAEELEVGMLTTMALGSPVEAPLTPPEIGPDDPWLLGLMAVAPFGSAEDISFLPVDETVRAVALTSLLLMGDENAEDLWRRNPWIRQGHPQIPDEVVLSGPRAWQEWLSGFSAAALSFEKRASWRVPNRAMADQMSAMLAGLGIKVSIGLDHDGSPLLHVPDDYGVKRLSSALWLRGDKGTRLKENAERLNGARPENYELDAITMVLAHVDPSRTLAIEVHEFHTFVTGGLVTHNTVGSNSATYYQTHGASKKHLFQTHGYGQALIDAGYPIRHVALAYIDRSNGQVVHMHYQPFDPGVVFDIENWWREVNAAADPMDLPRDEKGPGISRTCDWCVIPETQILMPDYTWRRAEEIEIGDVIMGWAETKDGRPGKLVPTEVTMVRRRITPLVRVNGDLVVAEGTKFSTRFGWRKSQNITDKDVKFVTAPIKRDQQMYERGWLAGMAQGDGTFWWDRNSKGEEQWRRFRLAVKDDADILLGRFEKYASAAGFATRRRDHTHTSFNGVTSKMPAVFVSTDADGRRFEEWISETPDDESWMWGYLGGITDAEGCVTGKSGTIRISQYAHKNEETYARIGMALHRVGFEPTAEWNGWCLKSAKGELFRFLAGATPGRPQFANLGLNRAPKHVTHVHEVTPAGEGEVVSLTVDAGSYVAEGYVVHNCPWLKACWGEDAAPGESGPQKIIVHEASDKTTEIEAHLADYHAASKAEKDATEAKKFARAVLVDTEAGQYGSYTLGWSPDGSYEVLDNDAAEKALTAAGLPVPKVARTRQGAIRVKPARKV